MSKFYLKIFSGIEQEIVLRAVQVKTDNYTPELARDFWAGLSRASGPLALAGHDSTDADAVASMLLLWRKLNEQGKDAALYFSQNDLAFVQNNSMLNGLLEQVKKMGAKVYTEGPGADQLPQKYTNLALLDTANANTRNKWLAAREFKHIFEIDHHFGGETLPVDAYIGSNLYASTAGLLGQIFLDNDLSIDKFDAHLLLVSVAGDTAGGRTALSENAWQLLEKLESYINEEADRLSGGELRELLKNILEGYYNGLKDYTAETLELAERLMENRQTISFSLPAGMAAESIKIITLDGGEQPDGKWRYYAQDSLGFGAPDTGLMAVRFQKDGRYKYALSCYNQFIGLENFDLRKFARMLDANGGGHRGAVGFFFDGSFAELQAKLQDFIRDELGPN